MSGDRRESLRERLDARAVPRDELARPGEREGEVRCVACARRCRIPEGRRGGCLVRFHRDGRLLVPWGWVAGGLALDPIEKKPFYHVLPGSGALSFGLLGCDMHCPYCQNWLTSQALRDPAAGGRIVEVTPEAIRELAVRHGALSVISTYNEPLISAEWAVDVFREAERSGLLAGFVSNGNATPEVLDFLRPHMDLFKVDLKAFREETYRKLGARLADVLAGIEGIFRRGFWLEVVTLVVPGLNDDPAELRDIASFLAGLSPDIPWHVTAFHPDYRMNDRGPTPVATLLRAVETGREAGLRYVYPGNVAGLHELASTRCPSCGRVLVERRGWAVGEVRVRGGRCPGCGTPIPGIWKDGRVPAAPAGRG